ncbi:MAG TPA: hypothetical protein VEY95_05600 [Azospirillaceae bacterium]|nr:hypothetical protein [Azospirillaceae bacterium]
MVSSSAKRILAGVAAAWLAVAAGLAAAQDTADEEVEDTGEVGHREWTEPTTCGELAYSIDAIAPVPVRGLAPGFRALHLAREDFETHLRIGDYVDPATGQLFTGYVVTRPDGSERFGLHNLHTGWYLQLVRSDKGNAFPGPARRDIWNTRGVERRIGLKAQLQRIAAYTIGDEATVETVGHRHLFLYGRLGMINKGQDWNSYICRSVDGGPAEAFFVAIVRDRAGRVVPDACAAVRDQGADALRAVPSLPFGTG